MRYANERLLCRLSKSPFRNKYVLKSATLFAIWTQAPYRPTRDVDLVGYGALEVQRLEREFRDIATQEVEPDGIKFKPATVP